MGSDGGICWMPLKNPASYERAASLIKPFWMFTQSSNADWQERANMDWLYNNPNISEPNYIVGTYGSSQDINLQDLSTILGLENNELCIDDSLTFLELIEDLETRPLLFANTNKWDYLSDKKYYRNIKRSCYDVNGKSLSLLECILWESLLYSEKINGLGCIANMQVNNWASELRYITKYNEVDSEETWT